MAVKALSPNPLDSKNVPTLVLFLNKDILNLGL